MLICATKYVEEKKIQKMNNLTLIFLKDCFVNFKILTKLLNCVYLYFLLIRLQN